MKKSRLVRSLLGRQKTAKPRAQRSRRLAAEMLETRAMLAGDPLVQIRLEAQDLTGNVITSVDAGEVFIVRAYVDDLRPNANAKGVASAYLDINFDPAIVNALPDSITFNPNYNVARKGDASSINNTTGLIDEIGAYYDLSKLVPPNEVLPGSGPVELFSIRFIGMGSGIVRLDANPAEGAGNIVTLVGADGDPTVAKSDIQFRDKNVAVGNVPVVSVADTSIEEGNSGTKNMTVTVNLSSASTETVTVKYETRNRTATAGSDYTSTTGTLTFAPGQTSLTFTIPISGDATNEGDETFYVVLSSPKNAIIETARGTMTILNDDGPPTLRIDDVTVTEGAQGSTATARFTVTLTGAVDQTVTVRYVTNAGTASAGADKDYFTTSGTLTFAPGELTKTIDVTINGDNFDEADETFFVVLSNATGGVSISDSSGTGTITDDDPLPELTIDDVTVTEGDGVVKNAVFELKLNTKSNRAVTVRYTTANVSAANGVDYTGGSGTITFNPGDLSKTITIPVIGDFDAEDVETFFVNLTNLVNATFKDNDSQAVGTIIDEDTAGELGVGSLSGFVYIDVDNDGVKDSGERGLGGVTLTLTGTDYKNTAVSKTVTTAADGSYTFSDLYYGNYVVKQTQPTGYADGKVTAGSQGGTAAANQLTIQLDNRENGTGNNFGEGGRLSNRISRADFFTPLAGSATAISIIAEEAASTQSAESSDADQSAATQSVDDDNSSAVFAASTASASSNVSRASFFVQPDAYGQASKNKKATDTVFSDQLWN